MTANTVHTMDSSETYSNYNGETWRDKNSVHGSVRDEYSFDQDSLSNFSYSRSTRGTPLHPIHEISGASTSSAASKKEEEGLLQNDVSSFISPSMSKSSMSTPASVHEVKQQLQKEPEQIQPRPAGKDSESFTHIFLSAVTLVFAATLVVHLTPMDPNMHNDASRAVSSSWWSPCPATHQKHQAGQHDCQPHRQEKCNRGGCQEGGRKTRKRRS